MIVYLFNVANFSRNNKRLLRPQLNEESIVQRATHRSLCGVFNQLIKHYNFIYHEGIESLVVRYGSVLSATFAERILFIMQVYRVLKKYSKFAFSKETVLWVTPPLLTLTLNINGHSHIQYNYKPNKVLCQIFITFNEVSIIF